ncbi:MAG: Phage integrase [Nocardioides sp.]|nr:Phage integrase [Nocardioides sp.]
MGVLDVFDKEDDGWLKIRGTLTREDGELVTTSTKTAKSRREVPITGRTAEILHQLRARQVAERDRAGSQWNETGYVFTTSFGEPCDPRNALRALKVAADQAGLPCIGLHTLRHSAASTMLANGVPLKVVSEIRGHSSISITGDIYGHVSPDISVSAMQVLSDALR